MGSQTTNSANPSTSAQSAEGICSNCSCANPKSHKFCGNCGFALLPLSPLSEVTPETMDASSRELERKEFFHSFLLLASIPVIILIVIAGLVILFIAHYKPSAESNPSPAVASVDSPASQSTSTSMPPVPLATAKSTPASQWNYTSDDDAMGRPQSFAIATSSNELDFAFPYGGLQHGTLTIRKTTQWGTDVILSIEQGQFICDPTDGCTVDVRFDHGAIHRYSASPPSDYSTTELFLSNTSSLIAHLRHAKTARFQSTFYDEGEQTLEFDVEGLKWP